MVFFSFNPERSGHSLETLEHTNPILNSNAGFNDAFIVPTVAGGVPRDGREPG